MLFGLFKKKNSDDNDLDNALSELAEELEYDDYDGVEPISDDELGDFLMNEQLAPDILRGVSVSEAFRAVDFHGGEVSYGESAEDMLEVSFSNGFFVTAGLNTDRCCYEVKTLEGEERSVFSCEPVNNLYELEREVQSAINNVYEY